MRIVTRAAAGLAAAIALTAGLPGVAHAAVFPSRIELPSGFQPEGIVIGRGTTFYAGSIPTGAIYRGDLRTGEGAVLPGTAGNTSAIGLAIDEHERLFVAGGNTGRARVIDGTTGETLATYQLTTAPTFVNDVEVAGDSAWFTDSVNPVLYRVPLDLGPAEVVSLTGDLVYTSGFNVNGIEATPDGKTLILVQSNTGRLFTADASGVTRAIDLGGDDVRQGDGILLSGQTLYVLQNRSNIVAEVALAPDLASGAVVSRTTDAGFSVPTTLDRFGNRLYAVNARFGTPATPTTPYWITAIPLP